MDTFQNCYKLLKFSYGCENAKFQILMFEQVNIDNFGHSMEMGEWGSILRKKVNCSHFEQK